MPDKKISELTAVASLDGTEMIEVVQTTNKRATLTQVKAFFQDIFASLSGTEWDLSTGTKKKKVLSANTELTLINSVNGVSVALLFVTQDSTGSRTLKIQDVTIEINPDASSTTLIGIVDVGGGAFAFDTNFGTGGSLPGGGGTWEDITFPTLTAVPFLITESPTHIFVAGNANEWAHKGLSDMVLAADGRVRMQYETTDSKFAELLLSVADGLEEWSTADVGVVIYTGGAIKKSEGGSQSADLATIGLGEYVCIQRVGTAFKIQTSPDGDTWTTIHTYTFTGSASMHIKMSLYNLGEMHFPMGEGVS